MEKIRVERFVMFEDAKNNTDEFVHDGGIDNIVVFMVLKETGDKFLNERIVKASDEGRHKQRTSEAGVAKFAKMRFAMNRGAGATFGRGEASIGGELTGILKQINVRDF